MKYIDEYQRLKEIFSLDQDEIRVPESSIMIRNLTFTSKADIFESFASQKADDHIIENLKFRYPVFLPDNRSKSSSAIILLHGLNERSWHKHLTGARFLAEKTGKPVILFPLSFHINRGLPEWSDARKMSDLLLKRKNQYPSVKDASIANYALSERLTECPERFFISGLQSMEDLMELITTIREGNHEFFEKGAQIDFFAYSISCMLLQALMISNPGNMLDRSKIVLFAGGSLFCKIRGISRFIMDSIAFETIHTYYMDMVSKKAENKELRPWIRENQFGRSFIPLIMPDYMKKTRQKAMASFSDNLLVIALQNDRVMPVEGIREAVGEKLNNRLKILHFPYEYSHENPFPVLYKKMEDQVERAFKSLFNPVAEFYV